MERLTKRTTIGTALDTMSQSIRNDNIARSAYIQSVIEKLAVYEDAEEQGRLEIITQAHKKARDHLENYSADDNFFDSEYS